MCCNRSTSGSEVSEVLDSGSRQPDRNDHQRMPIFFDLKKWVAVDSALLLVIKIVRLGSRLV